MDNQSSVNFDLFYKTLNNVSEEGNKETSIVKKKMKKGKKVKKAEPNSNMKLTSEYYFIQTVDKQDNSEKAVKNLDKIANFNNKKYNNQNSMFVEKDRSRSLTDIGDTINNNDMNIKNAPNKEVKTNTTNMFPSSQYPVNINNIFNINKKLQISESDNLWYVHHPITSQIHGPVSSLFLIDLYNNGFINGLTNIRLIDIFQLKDNTPFSFFELKQLNDDNFKNTIISLLSYKYSNINNINNLNNKDSIIDNLDNSIIENKTDDISKMINDSILLDTNNKLSDKFNEFTIKDQIDKDQGKTKISKQRLNLKDMVNFKCKESKESKECNKCNECNRKSENKNENKNNNSIKSKVEKIIMENRCKNWLKCKDENCKQYHPIICKYFPKCKFGTSCLNIHPIIPCKYGLRCIRNGCSYSHFLTDNQRLFNAPMMIPQQNINSMMMPQTQFINQGMNMSRPNPFPIPNPSMNNHFPMMNIPVFQPLPQFINHYLRNNINPMNHLIQMNYLNHMIQQNHLNHTIPIILYNIK